MLPAGWQHRLGKGVRVGVCDTGIDPSVRCLRGRVERQKAFGPVNAHHGTFVCSTVLRVAPRAHLVVASCLFPSVETLLEMVRWADSQGVDVLNLSLSFGAQSPCAEELCDYLLGMVSRGVAVVCAYSERQPLPWSRVGLVAGRDFCPPREATAYTAGNVVTTMRGTSISCALVSGMMALCRAVNPAYTGDDFIKEVRPEDLPLQPIDTPTRQYIVHE